MTIDNCQFTIKKNYGGAADDLIRSFRHKGLARFYKHGNPKGLSADMAPRISRILARLDIAVAPEQMNLPGWGLHPLKGGLKGFWSVWVTGNRRIVFRFDAGDVVDVDLVDYH
ncbi:MAG: type II toxin-antitoxin system RelE/ParE family toxin [Nitrosospira sp.]|nr:type II toxin-antitoxin system RelE/ParE family toxin [Nitrosospira sp.]